MNQSFNQTITPRRQDKAKEEYEDNVVIPLFGSVQYDRLTRIISKYNLNEATWTYNVSNVIGRFAVNIEWCQ